VIGTIVFVVAFVGIGLAVVLAAMRSGRRAPGAGIESRGARRATYIAVGITIIVIGLAVPVLVMVTNGNGHAENGPGGVDLNAAETNGRALFVRNCATCHTLNATHSVGRVGPNLDQLAAVQGKPAFVLDAIHKGRARGQGQMPAALLLGVDARDVAEFVAKVSGR
jgi:mono/diheme cytochrome c family protein